MSHEAKMTAENLSGQFEQALAAVPSSRPGKRVWKLIDLFRAHQDDIVGAFPTEDEAVAWAIALYDKVIAPKMPDMIDAITRPLIEALVRGLYPG